MRQLKILTWLELCNLYGINVIRKTKDKAFKKKVGIFAIVITLLLMMVLSYVVMLCAGLVMLGAADIIPAYLIAIASFFIVFFDIFKIGGVIFRKKGYDIVSSLPLSDGAVVTSRFLRMYAESLLVALLIFLPGFAVYAVTQKPGGAFYPLAFWIVAVVPLLPLALAVLLGTLITGVASRMKHKSMAEAIFSLILVVGVMGLSMSLPGAEDEFSLDMLRRFSEVATSTLKKVYPPAVIMGRAMISDGVVQCILFTVVSLVVVALVMWVVTCNFHSVLQALYTTEAKHDYTLGKLKRSSMQKALAVREARRYFASGPYVSNTIIGPALGAIASVALLFTDVDGTLERFAAQMPVAMNMKEAIPFMIAAIMAMMNAVCISVSMEGKEWWIVKSLPLSSSMILNAKILFNLLLIAPFYIVAECSLLYALKPGIAGAFWVICIPALLIIFSCVFGLRINLLFPKMDWENETVAVKQSASSLLGGMGGVIATLVLVLPVLLLPKEYYHLICLAESLLLLAVTYALYRKNNCTSLENI